MIHTIFLVILLQNDAHMVVRIAKELFGRIQYFFLTIDFRIKIMRQDQNRTIRICDHSFYDHDSLIQAIVQVDIALSLRGNRIDVSVIVPVVFRLQVFLKLLRLFHGSLRACQTVLATQRSVADHFSVFRHSS